MQKEVPHIPFTIIVPYRDRRIHLDTFVPYMLRMFPNAIICIIEQERGKPFNRGKLLNIGYKIFKNEARYHAFHDVDMLPHPHFADAYIYPSTPTHIATMASQFAYKMPYPDYFGGIVLFNNADFEKVNGYSNNFWGWGAEDDHLRMRVEQSGLEITRVPCKIKSLSHNRNINPIQYAQNLNLLNQGDESGLTDCEYSVLEWYEMRPNSSCNHLLVSI